MEIRIEMKKIIRRVIDENNFPDWVHLRQTNILALALDSDETLPWAFTDKAHVDIVNAFIKNEYPTRQLFAFAYREDSDDIACFEKNKPGKVVIVHNWDEPGFEAGPEFISFDAWYAYALKVEDGDHDYDNILGIDFYP